MLDLYELDYVLEHLNLPNASFKFTGWPKIGTIKIINTRNVSSDIMPLGPSRQMYWRNTEITPGIPWG